MSLEAVTALIEANAKLSQTNREIWAYVYKNKVPNLDNYKRLARVAQELVSTLEYHPNRDIMHEGSYRCLKEILIDIKNKEDEKK